MEPGAALPPRACPPLAACPRRRLHPAHRSSAVTCAVVKAAISLVVIAASCVVLKLIGHQRPRCKQMVDATQEYHAIGVHMLGTRLFRNVDARAVGSHEIPACDHEITFPTSHTLGGCEAFLEVIGLNPVVRIDHRDGQSALGCGPDAGNAPRRVAIVAMRPVEPQMPDTGRIDPILRKAIGDQQMVGGYALPVHAVDAPLQE
jgi:hypothetical protein